MATKKTSKTPPKRAAKKKVARKRLAKKPLKKDIESIPEPTAGVYSTNELLQGKYCNVGLIKHTPREFIFDFIWSVDNHSLLASRIITSPAHAKEIYEALGKNIERYEKTHGTIHAVVKKKPSGSVH